MVLSQKNLAHLEVCIKGIRYLPIYLFLAWSAWVILLRIRLKKGFGNQLSFHDEDRTSLISFFPAIFYFLVELRVKEQTAIGRCWRVSVGSLAIKLIDKRHRFFFSSNVSEVVANEISTNLGFTRVEDLGFYLGIPLFHHRVGRNTFSFVLDKVQNCLNGWDARKLSFAGRLTLVKSVLFSIPNYFMTAARIPITICKEIEKVVRSFLWGSNNERRLVALVSWSDVCRPVDKCGLGVRRLHDQDMLFLLKLDFSLVTNMDTLWVRILKSKYNIHGIIPNCKAQNLPGPIPTK
ncbi:hypothetical protein V6Z12_A02G046600 [Gossypium hirsutum]